MGGFAHLMMPEMWTGAEGCSTYPVMRTDFFLACGFAICTHEAGILFESDIEVLDLKRVKCFMRLKCGWRRCFRYVYKIQWPSTSRPFQTLCIIRSNLHDSSYAAHRHRRLTCFTFVSLHVRVSHLAGSQPAFMQSAMYFGAETVSSLSICCWSQ